MAKNQVLAFDDELLTLEWLSLSDGGISRANTELYSSTLQIHRDGPIRLVGGKEFTYIDVVSDATGIIRGSGGGLVVHTLESTEPSGYGYAVATSRSFSRLDLTETERALVKHQLNKMAAAPFLPGLSEIQQLILEARRVYLFRLLSLTLPDFAVPYPPALAS